MRKISLIRLMPILLILLSATAIYTQETQPTPTTPSALISPTIVVAQPGVCDTVSSCLQQLDIANRRLQKTLDAYDHAIAVGNANADVVAAYRMLVDLLKEGLAIKDQFIADVKADNDFLRKQVHPSKSWLRKMAERIEKVAIFAAAFYLGGH